MLFRAEPGDIDILIVMMRSLYEHDGVPFDEERSRRVTLALLKLPEAGAVYLIRRGEAVAGYCVLTFGFSIEYDGRHGFIDELFIRDEFRSLGLGRVAIDEASEVCRSMGMKVILLEVAFENAGAQRLYTRVGFREHGRRLMSRSI